MRLRDLRVGDHCRVRRAGITGADGFLPPGETIFVTVYEHRTIHLNNPDEYLDQVVVRYGGAPGDNGWDSTPGLCTYWSAPADLECEPCA